MYLLVGIRKLLVCVEGIPQHIINALLELQQLLHHFPVTFFVVHYAQPHLLWERKSSEGERVRWINKWRRRESKKKAERRRLVSRHRRLATPTALSP